jgi:transcriptional regulator with XRE-family HTH domain
MTFNQAPEFTRSVYDSCDPKYLRELREAAGMDLVVLARTACLSVAQVRQLESDESDGLFYSEAIKRQAYKRVLMILGAEPPSIELPQDLLDAAKVADAHSTTLDQIVAMSEQPAMNRSTSHALHAALTQLTAHKQVFAALLLLMAAVTLFVVYGPQGLVSTTSASATASTAQPVLASEPVVASAPVASVPVASMASATAVAVAPVVAASSAASVKADTCAYSDELMPQLGPFVAQKEGRYVYLVSAANVDVCVVDGNKQATPLQLKAGENRSVYGVSPWQVSSSSLQKIQIFFQGGRVSLPDPAVNRVKLVEVPVAR